MSHVPAVVNESTVQDEDEGDEENQIVEVTDVANVVIGVEGAKYSWSGGGIPGQALVIDSAEMCGKVIGGMRSANQQLWWG